MSALVGGARRWASVIEADCIDALDHLEKGSVRLVMTSPPYSDQRKDTYGGVSADEYADWFLPRAAVFAALLAPGGSFVLNIKEKVVDGERSLYVHRLIDALRSEGWLWIEEYIWLKTNPMPGKWTTRCRDAFERCHHFTRDRNFTFHPERLTTPWKPRSLDKYRRMEQKRDPKFDDRRGYSHGSLYTKREANFYGMEEALPTNVIESPTECRPGIGHPAVFPLRLPEFFIQLFTDPEDTVLDPFAGSGTTMIAARALGRKGVGFELSPRYAKLCRHRLLNMQAYSHGGLL